MKNNRLIFNIKDEAIMENLSARIRSQLAAKAEGHLSDFASALIPNLSRPILGVRLPILRAMAKEMARGDWKTVLEEGLTDCTFEEVMLRGMVIGYAVMPWEQRWREICKFVPLIDNWSICDSCCATYKSVRKHRDEVWNDLLQLLHSEDEFFQRFAVVMMMDHFLVEDYIERVLRAWSGVVPHGYYAEMGIGWGFSVAFLGYPQQTLQVLNDVNVSLSCRKKACQKILESRRTPEIWRKNIQNLRAELGTYKK